MESTDETHILPCIKEFYETIFKNVNRSSLSQQKKDGDKRFIKNQRLTSLLNVDLKTIPKALSGKLKNALPDLIFSQQAAYVKTDILVKVGD